MRPRATSLVLAALRAPRGNTPRARRSGLLSESDERLGARLFAMLAPLRAIDDVALEALASSIDLPLGELVASPFGLRMIALGARLGVRTVRHETRSMRPRGVWEGGVLLTGKYAAFHQDDPWVTYHPEHVAKWAPHEYLHRAVGFFDRPRATRFERYVGARLNEILPVGTWYGLEHALRLGRSGQRFDATDEGLTPHADAAAATWRTDPQGLLRERCVEAAPRLRWTLTHAQRELDAIDRELAGGRPVRVVHDEEPHLDASSDAMAYAVAHHARLSREPLSRVLAAYAGTSRFTRLRDLRASVEDTLDALLFAPLALERGRVARAQRSRKAWDLASRVAHDSPARFLRIAPLVRARAPHEALARAVSRLPRAALLLCLGTTTELDVAQLDRGLRGAAPRTRRHTSRSLVSAFAESDAIRARGSLPSRFATYLASVGAPRWLVELCSLEAAIVEARRSDPVVEQLLERGPLPRVGDPFVTASRAFRLARFDTDVLARHAGGEPEDRPARLLVGRVEGAVSIVSIEEATALAWDRLSALAHPLAEWVRHLPNARAILTSLAAHGAVGWAPVTVRATRR